MPIRPVRQERPEKPNNPGKPERTEIEKRKDELRNRVLSQRGYEMRGNVPVKIIRDRLGRIAKEEPIEGQDLILLNARLVHAAREVMNRRP